MWKPIINYEELYSASDQGQIRRDLTRTIAKKGAIKSQSPNAYGYPQVCLSKPGDKQRSIVVHKLVWEAFNGPIPNRLTINHEDGNKTNNCLDNLELMTIQENIQHAIEVLGHDRKGERNPSTTLTNETVITIRIARLNGSKLRDLAKEYSLTENSVRNITTGKTWSHISGPLTPSRMMKQTPQSVKQRITLEDIKNAVYEYQMGRGATELSVKYNVSRRTIYNWIGSNS